MPLNLPQMVGQWQTISRQHDLVAPGSKQVLDVNPKRVALGFGHLGSTTPMLTPRIDPTVIFPFFLRPGIALWFYWEKHVTLMSFAWFFSTNELAGDTIWSIEIFQAGGGT